MKMNSKIFVYGTLRKHQVNNYLLNGAKYLGIHATRPGYKMFHLGGYPGVVKGGGCAVQGEVYAVDSKIMISLDRLEGYPHAYSRELIATPWGKAWIYLYRGSLAGKAEIPSGFWQDQVYQRRWTR